jgi:hypothetical protein
VRNKSVKVVLIISCLIASSCGYHFTPVGGVIPEGARTIAIPVFLNGTTEPYIDIEVTRAVVEEFMTDGRLKIAELDEADLVLRGVITKFSLTPASYSPDLYVQSYTVSIGVSVTVEDARTRKVLLEDTGIGSVFNSGYAVALGNISQTKIAKDAAIRNAGKDLASTLRSRILEGF